LAVLQVNVFPCYPPWLLCYLTSFLGLSDERKPQEPGWVVCSRPMSPEAEVVPLSLSIFM
jgi:hypothetical protein